MEHCAWCRKPPHREDERGGSGYCGNCKSVFYCSREHQVLDWKNHACRMRPSAMYSEAAIIGWPMHMSTDEEKKGFALFTRLQAKYLPSGDLLNDDMEILRNVWRALNEKQRTLWRKKAATSLGVSSCSDEQVWVYFVNERKDKFIKVDREYYLKKPGDLKDRSAAAQVWRNLIKSERMDYIKKARDGGGGDDEDGRVSSPNSSSSEARSSSSSFVPFTIKEESKAVSSSSATSSAPFLFAVKEEKPKESPPALVKQDLKRELENAPLDEKEKKHLGYLEFIRTVGAPYHKLSPKTSHVQTVKDIFRVIPDHIRTELENEAIFHFGDSDEAVLMRVNMVEHEEHADPVYFANLANYEDGSHAARMWAFMSGNERNPFIDKALSNKKAKTTPAPVLSPPSSPSPSFSSGMIMVPSVRSPSPPTAVVPKPFPTPVLSKVSRTTKAADRARARLHAGYLKFREAESEEDGGGKFYKDKVAPDSIFLIAEALLATLSKRLRRKNEIAYEIAAKKDPNSELDEINFRKNKIIKQITKEELPYLPHPTEPNDAASFEDGSYAARIWAYMSDNERKPYMVTSPPPSY